MSELLFALLTVLVALLILRMVFPWLVIAGILMLYFIVVTVAIVYESLGRLLGVRA